MVKRIKSRYTVQIKSVFRAHSPALWRDLTGFDPVCWDSSEIKLWLILISFDKSRFIIPLRVGNFRQEKFRGRRKRRNKWLIPTGFRLFRVWTENFPNSVPNPSAEEKTTRKPVLWNKNRSKLSNSLPNPSAEEKELEIPFRGTKIEANSRNSLPNPSAEEKTTRNSIPWNKSRSKFSEFRSETFRGREKKLRTQAVGIGFHYPG